MFKKMFDERGMVGINFVFIGIVFIIFVWRRKINKKTYSISIKTSFTRKKTCSKYFNISFILLIFVIQIIRIEYSSIESYFDYSKFNFIELYFVYFYIKSKLYNIYLYQKMGEIFKIMINLHKKSPLFFCFHHTILASIITPFFTN